jgi:hypothetical protein
MMKQQKTAAELAIDLTRVLKCRRRAEEIAAELRATYELKV